HQLSIESLFLFNDTAPPEIYTLSLHDALPIWRGIVHARRFLTGLERGALDLQADDAAEIAHNGIYQNLVSCGSSSPMQINAPRRSEEHTSELQSRFDLVCRLLLEKKKTKQHTS